ncbi:MAG: hypothetical protein HYR72_02550 [Deltaproteobacteria bacterium]|nr:hypothetical protein [Deltaproteobacteria bacterium]MBI3388294.1 hypothetical protein [Deltaproteobacteria bacterium]
MRLTFRFCSLAVAVIVGGGDRAQAILNSATDLSSVAVSESQQISHGDEATLEANGFDLAFEVGDVLFATHFNALDGVGNNVGNGQRFTRVPRADLTGATQWATQNRATGANADSCNSCHAEAMSADQVTLFDRFGRPRFKRADGAFITDLSAEDRAGRSHADAVRDPNATANVSQFVERNTPHLFGMGGVQRVAEEVTADLQGVKNSVIADACNAAVGVTKTRNLNSANRARKIDGSLEALNFGSISATRVASGGTACPSDLTRTFTLDTSAVQGVDADLVVRPFQWKGVVGFTRDFTRGASHNELGMQSVEVFGDNVDGDGDGIANEMTIGDQTALAVYMGGQPRPVTTVELSNVGIIAPALPAVQKDAIRRGTQVFNNIGCTSCHKLSLLLSDPTFSEPSLSPFHRDNGTFPAGQAVPAPGAIQFNLTTDISENQIFSASFHFKVADLGNFRKQDNHFLPGFGKTLVDCFGDVKRHNLGSNVAEAINEGSATIPAGTFMTENLWGVGSTAPYLHDGRATTFSEAVLEHTCVLNQPLPGRPGVNCSDRGEAAASADSFRALPASQRGDIEAFANSLVLFKVE